MLEKEGVMRSLLARVGSSVPVGTEGAVVSVFLGEALSVPANPRLITSHVKEHSTSLCRLEN